MSEPPGRDAGPAFAQLPGPLRIAVALVALQAVALAGFGVFLLVEAAVGHPHSVPSALLEALLAVLGGVAFGAGARGLAAGRPAARTPIVVLELIALPVGYTLGFDAGLPAIGAPILAVALAVLCLLFTPPVRALLDREL